MDDIIKRVFEKYKLKIDVEKMKQLLDKYDWKDAEKCMSELQFAINLFTYKQLIEGKRDTAQQGISLYTLAVTVFREFRTLLENDGLLCEEDYEKAEEELRKEGKSIDGIIEPME